MRNFLSLTILLLLFAPALAQNQAVAVIESTNQREAPQARRLGEVYFHEEGGALIIQGHLEGLEPGSQHGFHIHKFGDLSRADATSAGGHFAPEGHPHAGPNAAMHHAGDLGNVVADKNGEVDLNMRANWLTLKDILGRSVVLHAHDDDLKSQPSGDAGPRIGAGVIGWANTDRTVKR
ncbi:MAG: superoxide dismutase family protein [Candidatus Eremiobacteraeota bacterium]|nr:superoxide dismutase family protein [Candidatus Eremiobacteraeota bacterium]